MYATYVLSIIYGVPSRKVPIRFADKDEVKIRFELGNNVNTTENMIPRGLYKYPSLHISATYTLNHYKPIRHKENYF